MASLAEMERELTVERTRAGLEVARQLDRKGGRQLPRTLNVLYFPFPETPPRNQRQPMEVSKTNHRPGARSPCPFPASVRRM
jgi:DNA invertase Pin-like site-specific DNA recombinase